MTMQNLKPETRNQRSEVSAKGGSAVGGRGQRSEVRAQSSEVRGQKSEVRGQKSEVRSQRSEVRGQIYLSSVICLLGLLLAPLCWADTIVLKSGAKIDGEIIEATDEYISIDFQGAVLTYYKDEILQVIGGVSKKDMQGHTKERSAGEFSPFMLIVGSVDSARRMIEQKTSSTYIGTETLASSLPVVIALGAEGFALNANGECDLTFNVKIVNPEGVSNLSESISVRKKITKDMPVCFAEEVLEFSVSDNDTAGIYTIEVKATDAVAGKEAQVQETLYFAKKISGGFAPSTPIDTVSVDIPGILGAQTKGDLYTLSEEKPLTMKEVIELRNYYYRNPQPAKLIPLLRFFLTHHKRLYAPEDFASTLHFFCVLAYYDQTFFNNLNKLKDEYSDTQKALIEKIINEAENFSSARPDSLEHLDYLWAEFFATGRDAPLKKIMSVLIGEKESEDVLIIAYAEGTLLTNAAMHKRVHDAIKREVVHAIGQYRMRLRRILKESKRKDKVKQTE